MYCTSELLCIVAWHACAVTRHNATQAHCALQVRISSGSSGNSSEIHNLDRREAQSPKSFTRNFSEAETAVTAALSAKRPVSAAAGGKRLTAAASDSTKDRSLKSLAQSTAAAAGVQEGNAHAEQPAGLQQLRALAGSQANSPAGHVQLDKEAAQKLGQLADTPLTDWQSPAALAASHPDAHARSNAVRADDTPEAASKGSPTPSWDDTTPLTPITLNINVFGGKDEHAGSTDPHGSPGPQGGSYKTTASSLSGHDLSDQLSHAAALQHQQQSAVHNPPVQADLLAVTVEKDTLAVDKAPAAATHSKQHKAPQDAALHSQSPDAAVAESVTMVSTATGPAALYGMQSSGADELAAAAAAGTAGSPWDPQQGPRLLESLSDFSSFNSSLSMLQQLAGKSCPP